MSLAGIGARAGGTNNIKGLHALLIARLGLGLYTHSHEIILPGDDTHIAYAAKAVHLPYGGGLRLAYRLGALGDLWFDACYLGHLPLWSREAVSDFRVRGQRHESEPAALGVRPIARSPWQVVSLALGFSVFF